MDQRKTKNGVKMCLIWNKTGTKNGLKWTRNRPTTLSKGTKHGPKTDQIWTQA